MKSSTIFRLLSIIIGGLTLLKLPSLVLAIVLGEYNMIRAFLVPLVPGLSLAFFSFFFIKKTSFGIRIRDGFLLVFLTWVFASLAGSLPYYFSGLGISFSDAIFESTCGFSTTGATTFSDIEILPRSLLLWRSMSHWAGGMGIIVLTVALMPLLGIGGFQLFKAETPGPEKDKITPKITYTAKIIWGVYCIFTVILALLYRLGGMDWFDAFCHGFTIMATGGVSTKNSGFAFYDSAFIDWITVVFMLIAAINFNLYIRLFRLKFRDMAHNTEFKVFLIIFFVSAFIISLNLVSKYDSIADAIRIGTFQTASIFTSTGNVRADFTSWPFLSQAVLFCLMFIGGCSGSTAGGLKVIRITVLFKQAVNELKRIIYPQGVFSIQLNRKVGRKDVVYGVAGFVFIYFSVIALATIVTAAAGYDLSLSFNTAVSMTGNIGAGFGSGVLLQNFSSFPAPLKLFYSLIMIAGRLEFWAVVVLFTPQYWKR